MSHRDFLPAASHDLFLPVYDPIVSLLGFDRAQQELISFANIQPHDRILDIGCGTGTLVLMLKRKFPAVQVAGLDPDPKALRRARRKVARAAISAEFDQGFADNLPYEDESFDRVLSSFMFHHLTDQEREKMLREALRVLKPGGSLHLLDFITHNDSNGFLHRLFQSHALMKDNQDEAILALMNRAGLTNAVKVNEGTMLFGLLQTSYYEASARIENSRLTASHTA
jgi:ubiquinone/menaquinone biosynthesis C-methylase UbiE